MNEPKLNIRAEIDKKSFYECRRDNDAMYDYELSHYEWEIDHSYEDGDCMVFVIKATGRKPIDPYRILTPEEFKTEMQKIYDLHEPDLEAVHCEMDTLMCNLLVGLGYGEGIAIFQ